MLRNLAAVPAWLASRRGWRADGAAFGLGAVAACALPPFYLLPALWLAFPGLLILLAASAGPRQAARRGFWFGFGLHMVGLYWVTNAVLVRAAEFWWAVPLAVPALSAVLSLFIAAPCALARLAPAGWPRIAVLTGAWVLGDLAREFVLTGFPWNPLGSIWAFDSPIGLAFMAPAAWIEVHGLTLATVALACLPALGRRGWLAALAALIVWASAGFCRLQAQAVAAPNLLAVLVQGNVPEEERLHLYMNPQWDDAMFARHLALTRQGVAQTAGHAALVVWPETASPYWLTDDSGARGAVAQASGPHAISLIGSPRRDAEGGFRNSLVAVPPDGSVAGFYDKFHLVPYGEYFPSYLPIRLGEQGWQPGPGLATLHIPGLPAIGPLICYEAIFPGQVVLENDRPALLVNVTNDGWFGNSSGPRQHLVAARMRAVEEGLPMLRAANRGISAIIDPHGRVLTQLGLNQTGTVVGPVPGALPATLAGKLSLWGPFFLSIFAISLGFWGVIRRKPVSTA